MLRGILPVGGWTMASRLLGFLRDILISDLLGAGAVGDAFFVANKLPNLFRRLFGEGAFNAAFVPSFAGLLASEGHAAAQAFAEQAAAVLAFWLVGMTVLAEAFMPGLMALLAPGFAADPAKFDLAVTLSRITFPYMPLICLTALLSGVLNGLDRFAAAAAAPVIYNLTSIAFMEGLLHVLPTAGHALAIGVSVSGVFQLALVAWAVWRSGFRLHLPRPRLTPAMQVLFRRMAPGLLGAGVTQLNLSVDLFISSLLPAGTVSILYYADRINQLPLGIIGASVGTALLPTLSRQVLGSAPEAAIGTINRAIEYALVLTLPAALALVVVPDAIVATLFEHGRMTAADAHRSAQALAAYALGLPAFVLVKVVIPGFFARGDTTMPLRIGVASVALNVALNVAFMRPLQHMGPPLAASLAAWANVAALAWVLHRRGQFVVDDALNSHTLRMIAASMAMAGVLVLLQGGVFAPLAGRGNLLRMVGLAVLVGGGMAAYGVAGQALGAFDLRTLIRQVRRRGRRALPEG
jgi:putative peptidoglycan lipid II flippase